MYVLEDVLFLESGNDITTKQQIHDAITCHKCGFRRLEMDEALELNSEKIRCHYNKIHAAVT
jgi:hypothetical protein